MEVKEESKRESVLTLFLVSQYWSSKSIFFIFYFEGEQRCDFLGLFAYNLPGMDTQDLVA